MAIPEIIEKLAHKVRTEIYGRDVREALATSMEVTAEVAEWSRDVAQQILDGSFDEGALNTEIERKLNELEQQYAPDLSSVRQDLNQYMQKSFEDKNRAEFYSKLVELDKSGGTVTMVGDSLTGGVSSGGHPYFEPWQDIFPNINFINKGIGGNTSKDILDRVDDIATSNADLYVIACGTNDVRYQNENSALNGDEYVSVINDIITALSPADFILINPWPAFDKDSSSKIAYYQRDALTNEFTASLAEYAKENGYPFIETNRKLRNMIDWGNKNVVLVDAIHPRYPKGINLYSDVVLYGNVNGESYGLRKTKSVGKHLYRIEVLGTSKLETQFNNISLRQLYADVPILEIWTDNYRNNTSDPEGLISGYNDEYRFSNGVGQYPVNITFSTNEPIKELFQLEERLYRLIGKYNLYYSTNQEAIVDINHRSWIPKYSSQDVTNGIGTLLYKEPYLNMEERYYYMLTIIPKGQGVRLGKIKPDKNIIRHEGKVFSSLYPVTSHLIVEHAVETRTGTNSPAYYFFSTNSKILSLDIGFFGPTGNFDLVVSFADRFNTLSTDETHNDWQEILASNDISTSSEVTLDIPNH